MNSVQSRIHKIIQRIRQAERQFGRDQNDVSLLAVSKKHTISSIEDAFAEGQKAFGESYLQEALPKVESLVTKDIDWHFIGPIQSNKTKDIARYFTWVQSVSRLKIAHKLNEYRPANLAKLNICIQIKMGNEASKSGIPLEELAEFADKITSLERLKLRGLMLIPEKTMDFEEQRKTFKLARQAFLRLQQSHPQLDTLSMGMSGDLEAAIAEGSTLVRVGTDIFGKRT